MCLLAIVQPGNLLLVKPGEILPVDGVVEDGAAMLDESALTGEPIPVARKPGDAVRSGGVNAGSPFLLRATGTAAASTFAAIVRLVEQAEQERPPMVRLADKWAVWFLLATLAAAGAAWRSAGDRSVHSRCLSLRHPAP